MGEFHYARCPASEWRTELLKMKAGGIDVIATYVFWIHHEEIEGKWDWSGRRDLRHFISICKDLGLKVVLRGGPWVHGECRNGGFPDWVAKRYKTRTADPAYLTQVSELYRQIGRQMSGLSWEQGGPVVGFQVENEFGGSGEYLAKLKQMAIDAGIHVPLYTRTGWPQLQNPVPAQDIFPMYGGYPVGFWDRGIEETAKRYGTGYMISLQRNPDQILQGKSLAAPASTNEPIWPYMCCEIGGGMAVSYHRRISIAPDDVGSLALVKLASGNNVQGYYMYHGGANPDGKLTTLNETQATGYWNDAPVLTYDFQAPIGEAGQLRPHYHLLRRMHLLMRDFGAELAGMPAFLPERKPVSSDDSGTLRWSVRSDGHGGFIFVNNFQRLQAMPAKPATQFGLKLSSGPLMVPSHPVDIPGDSYFIWPFNLNLNGLVLRYATAQPICVVHDGLDTSYFFAETAGVAPEFSFDLDADQILSSTGSVKTASHISTVCFAHTGLSPAMVLRDPDGHKVNIFVLDSSQSLSLWKGPVAGIDRVLICSSGIEFDKGDLRITRFGPEEHTSALSIYPPVEELTTKGHIVRGRKDGSFSNFDGVVPDAPALPVEATMTSHAGPLRTIAMGSQNVSEQPSDADFELAQVWRLKLPDQARHLAHPILRLRYVGDVAHLYLNGKLISDNFYNGKSHEIDLAHYGPEVFKGKLELKVLPLAKDAPIYLAPGAKPDFSDQRSACQLLDASIYGVASTVWSANRQ